MILLLDTSTSVCKLTLIEGDTLFASEWQADRTLARDLLGYLDAQLKEHDWGFGDITGIGVFKGPGSFTGLRIGLTVLNTIADAQAVPIVGATGDAWQAEARSRLEKGENDRIVPPLYSSDPHITKPRK